MQKRGRLWLFLGAALFLLLLSALVETGADPMEGQASVRAQRRVYEVAFLPDTAATQFTPSLVPLPPGAARLMMACALVTMPMSAACFFSRDANGRWLRKKRYVESVYEVFRQEAACG